MVIPVAPAFQEYADTVFSRLREAGFRVDLDDSDDRMNAKIRSAQTQKIPYMLILGEKEAEAGSVALRLRTGKQENDIPLEAFVARVSEAVTEKVEI